MQYNFMNDYNECAHERILAAIAEANRTQDGSYGLDTRCENARALIRNELKNPRAAVHFLVGGTQTNTTLIAAAIRPHQGVIAPDTGHISLHESGAIESTGHKVLSIPAADGKITADRIEALIAAHYADETAEHMVQPGMVYLSNPTELGTIYCKAEITSISEVCKRYHIPLYIDGARLGCAMVAEGGDMSLSDYAALASAFTIGGTKLGALFGEALVICDPALNRDFRYLIKQRGGMLAKGRLLGIQFETLFADGLYYEIARHEVSLAQKLAKGLRARGYTLFVDSPTNQVFPVLDKALQKTLAGRFGYAYWQAYDEKSDVVRFCTSWATPTEQVDALLSAIPNKQ